VAEELEALIPEEFKGLTIEQEIEKLRAENEALSRGKAPSVKASPTKVTIENSSKTFPEGESPDPTEECCHLCQPSIPNSKGPQGCGLWWSHGPRSKCKHPDLVNHGLCPKCLGVGTEPFNPLEDFDADKEKLTPQGIMKSANKARVECADMDVEQLTHHILFLTKQVEMLRAEAMGTRKLRTEKEEEALLNIPPAEREKFIQALRQGKDGKPRKPRASKSSTSGGAAATPGVKLDKYERSVRSLMASTGKTRAQVEAYLND
jgi:hypothetical protein